MIAVAIAFLLFIVVPAASGFFADLWWFREIGYDVVFVRTVTTRLLLFLVAGAVGSAVLYLNLSIAQRGVVPEPVMVRMGEAVAPVDVAGATRRLRLPISILFGIVFGLGVSATWQVLLQWLHRTPFDVADPVFSRDIGYYVFSLPALSVALGMISTLAFVSLLATVPTYFFRGDVVVSPRRLRIEPSAGVHLAILLAVPFVVTALRLWFVDSAELLYSTTGPLVGASYTDLHATLPAIRVSAIAALAAAVVVLVGGARRMLGWYGVLAVGGYVSVAILGRGIVPAIMQKFVVAPTELTRETPYLERHIAATRRAWGIDSVQSRDLEGVPTLTLASLRANAATIENVRLWDRAPLLRTFGQLQEIRTYYDFVSVDDDRYWIDGKYRQVLLSPRELNAQSLPTRTFINEHLTFTHGMGLTMSPVNQVTTQGLPVLLIQDLPPATTGSLRVSRPQIYYGELAQDFVFVGTRQKEFDYPAGEANIYTAYAGKGGVPVGGLFRRMLLALHFGNSKVLLSGDITSESRVLYNRNIVTRIRKALPFLKLDRDPYLVVADDGTLKWIQDAYTTSSRYPYSFRSPDGVTYMRNSVKVVIDAYDGTVTAYVSAPNDPLVRTWAKVFPGIFVPIDSMAKDLRAHVRYPDDMFRAQTALYSTYHMDKPEEFYHREDQWQVPVVTRPDEAVPFMRHIIMRLPDEPEAEFIYMAPFTPRGKDNLAAWMVARNDGAEYGKLRVYRFPRQSLVFGPRQIENRINQDTEIARQVSLWDQRGSEVIRGDLLVIPIDHALLYVQPLYLQAEGGRIPELKRVLVAYENQVVMRETLELALQALFAGGGDAPITQAVPVTGAVAQRPAAGADTVAGTASAELQSLVVEARRRYQAAIEAQREGDWSRYGEEIRRLGELLERMGRK
ncbi:MAG: UPF0182 family protein [Gemmatimonadetes bacterium]|nr:UPF0182 family protein [Gemmatimonadota bacterium]